MRKYLIPGSIAFLAVMACAAWTPANWFPVRPAKNHAALHLPGDTSKLKATHSTVQWLDFESGFAKAKKEHKILLVDVYTDWCGYCKVMDRETYTNDTVIRTLKQHFVTVKLNPEKERKYVMN